MKMGVRNTIVFCNNLSVVTAGVIFYPYAFTESFINLKTYCEWWVLRLSLFYLLRLLLKTVSTWNTIPVVLMHTVVAIVWFASSWMHMLQKDLLCAYVTYFVLEFVLTRNWDLLYGYYINMLCWENAIWQV